MKGPKAWLAMAALAVAMPLAATSCEASAEEHIVRVVSDYKNLRMYFQPKSITIEPGDTVTWHNEVKEDHNVLTFPDGYPQGADGFKSPDLKERGQRWSHTFTVIGTYEYHCLPHLPMGMRGVVIVGRPSRADEFHRPSRDEVAAYRDRLLEYFDEDEYQYKLRRQQQGALDPKDTKRRLSALAAAHHAPAAVTEAAICRAPRG